MRRVKELDANAHEEDLRGKKNMEERKDGEDTAGRGVRQGKEEEKKEGLECVGDGEEKKR